MAKQDYYTVLGVSRNAADAELKKAYKRLAMKHHPDRNEGDASAEARFKEAKEAYDVLSDERKRTAYDQFGHAGVNNSAGQDSSSASDIFDSVFGDIFGGDAFGSGKQRAYRGADLRYELSLSLEDAVSGTTVRIRIPKLIKCGNCSGSGAKKGSTPSTCPTCAGQGQVRMQQGFFSLQQACPQCRGQGKIIKDPCTQCRGQGRVKDIKKISVKVPPGVDNGDRIRLSNEGEAGENSGSPGDLYVHVNVQEHAIFARDDINLHCEVPISYAVAALGGEIEVPTLGGYVKLKIPAATQSGRLFRLRSKGVKSVRSSVAGDLFCRVAVETPVNLTKEQKKLFQELEHTMRKGGTKHSPQTSSWLNGVKKFFDNMKN